MQQLVFNFNSNCRHLIHSYTTYVCMYVYVYICIQYHYALFINFLCSLLRNVFLLYDYKYFFFNFLFFYLRIILIFSHYYENIFFFAIDWFKKSFFINCRAKCSLLRCITMPTIASILIAITHGRGGGGGVVRCWCWCYRCCWQTFHTCITIVACYIARLAFHMDEFVFGTAQVSGRR